MASDSACSEAGRPSGRQAGQQAGNSVGADFQQRRYIYRAHADQAAATPVRHPVVIVGAGPVGLSLAIDLAQQEIPVVLLDEDDRLSTGSRAICFAKRTLEIFDRLGCGDRMVQKGVSWNLGRVFHCNEQLYRFDLLPESGHARPAFINLQQYYVEGYLAERAAELPLIDLRWKHQVTGIEQHAEQAVLTIATPDGTYRLAADHVVACDGGRSGVRRLLGLSSQGRSFRDRFLIADVRMKVDFPAERWFWFDPPFHPNQSVLLHKQPDDVWRIDFQLGWDADPEFEKQPVNILPRVRALLAHTAMKDADFELEWASVYTFACLRMDSFRHGRVCFAGDAAHGVSPFGARGANSGVQDAENLAWKLALVVHGEAPDALLTSYARERESAADENIRHSTRSTDFITPKSEISRLFRDATLSLAKDCAFARTLVNSGRLSVPATLYGSVLNTPDTAHFQGCMVPGAPCADAPVTCNGRDSWLLRELHSGCFTALLFAAPQAPAAPVGTATQETRETTAQQVAALHDAARGVARLQVLRVVTPGMAAVAGARDMVDVEGLLTRRYDGLPGTLYLLRPDQHVCARWRNALPQQLQAALRRALALA